MQDANKKKYEFFLSSEVKMKKKNSNHNKLLNKPN